LLQIAAYFALFLSIGAIFVFANLLIGRLVRPHNPHAEKTEVYECGEPTVGSSYLQFDLRFYVVALLFVIFDVELAFFFPWAVVFGSATRAGNEALPAEQRMAAAQEIQPIAGTTGALPAAEPMNQLAWFAFLDILVFFGVLLVGFAYLWRRGDLDWVRSTAAQPPPQPVR
jgi:NADH-quinone oxidoreductase subunit A